MNFISFDASHAVQKEIKPIVDELRALCRAHSVPVTVIITAKVEETEDSYNFSALYMTEAVKGRVSVTLRRAAQ